jgi:FHS family L-fucose permease-like MFS transporter
MTDTASPAAPKGAGAAFAYVTTLFFAWGFATSLLDPLVAAVKRVFDLSYTEAFLTGSAWFIAYGVASLPAAALLSKAGYSKSILGALGVMVLGCLIVPVATMMDQYAGVLLALFVIASGVTLLQVAANPLVAVLGEARRTHFRLNLSQAFNSLGTAIGPWLGSHVLLTGGVFAAGAAVTASTRGDSLRSIDIAFLGLGAFFFLVALFIFTARKKIDAAAPAAAPAGQSSPLKALSSPWAIAGALAIFAYVGSEVAIGTMMTNFLASPDVLNKPYETAGKLVSFYWLGAMVGRFVGAVVLRYVKAGVVMAFCTLAAAALCFFVMQAKGVPAGYAALSIGLFNSVMFPTIFTLTLERSSAPTSATSGLLVFGIIGGAFLPLIAGAVADSAGHVSPAFIVPLAGYLALTAFAVACIRSKPREADAAPAAVTLH